MNVNQKIIEALRDLAPVMAEMYTGEQACYFTFNYSTFGAAYADDDAGCERYLVQVHLFTPLGENSVSLRKQAKQRLAAAGFTRPSEICAGVDGTKAGDKRQHYVFECETVEAISNGSA